MHRSCEATRESRADVVGVKLQIDVRAIRPLSDELPDALTKGRECGVGLPGCDRMIRDTSTASFVGAPPRSLVRRSRRQAVRGARGSPHYAFESAREHGVYRQRFIACPHQLTQRANIPLEIEINILSHLNTSIYIEGNTIMHSTEPARRLRNVSTRLQATWSRLRDAVLASTGGPRLGVEKVVLP